MISVVYHVSYVSGLISLKVNSFSLFQPFPFLSLFLFLLCSTAFLPPKSGVRSPFCPGTVKAGPLSLSRLFPLFLHTWADIKQKIISVLWPETEFLLSWAALWLQFDESQITHFPWSVISAEAPHSWMNGSLLLTKGRNICRESNDLVMAVPSFLGNFLVRGPLE